MITLLQRGEDLFPRPGRALAVTASTSMGVAETEFLFLLGLCQQLQFNWPTRHWFHDYRTSWYFLGKRISPLLFHFPLSLLNFQLLLMIQIKEEDKLSYHFTRQNIPLQRDLLTLFESVKIFLPCNWHWTLKKKERLIWKAPTVQSIFNVNVANCTMQAFVSWNYLRQKVNISYTMLYWWLRRYQAASVYLASRGEVLL